MNYEEDTFYQTVLKSSGGRSEALLVLRVVEFASLTSTTKRAKDIAADHPTNGRDAEEEGARCPEFFGWLGCE